MSQVKFTKWECCVSTSRAISKDFFGIKKITMPMSLYVKASGYFDYVTIFISRMGDVTMSI